MVYCPQTNQQQDRLHGVWRWCLQVFRALSHSLHSQTQSACDQLSLDSTMCVQSRSVQKYLRDCWLEFPHEFRHFPCPHLACCKQKQCSHFRSKGHLHVCKVLQCFQQTNWLWLLHDFSMTIEIQIVEYSMESWLMYKDITKADPWFYLVAIYCTIQ